MQDTIRLTKKYFRYWKTLLCAFCFALIKCLGQMSLPALMAGTIDAGLERRDQDTMLRFAVLMVAVCVITGLMGFLVHMLASVAGEGFALELRNEICDHLWRFNLSDYESFKGETLLTRVTSDVNTCSFIPGVIIQAFFEPLIILISGILLVRTIAPDLGLLFLAAVIIQLAIVAVFIRFSMPLFLRIRRKTDTLNRYIQTLFYRLRLIKLFRKEDSEKDAFDNENEDIFRKGFAAQKLICVFHPLVMFIVDMSVVMILMYASVNTGSLRISSILEAISYSQQILLSIVISGQMIRFITEAEPSAKRVADLLRYTPIMQDGSDQIQGKINSLDICDVSFAYEGEATILEHMNLSVERGSFLAITGRMGCGKSTLAGLLIRYYDPYSGVIRINGKDLKEYSLEGIRRHIVLVEKNTAVFGGSVYDNIIFGRDYVNKDDALKASIVAQCADYIEKLPEKYDTYVNGRILSGGEKQRLAIARALSGNPEILILDEATSSMDYDTEARMLKDIRKVYPDITLILITQRTMSAARADQIAYIEDGRVHGYGTAEWLSVNCPGFGLLSLTQQGEVI